MLFDSPFPTSVDAVAVSKRINNGEDVDRSSVKHYVRSRISSTPRWVFEGIDVSRLPCLRIGQRPQVGTNVMANVIQFC